MSAELRKTWTVEAYLALERASEQKHEYLNGLADVYEKATFDSEAS